MSAILEVKSEMAYDLMYTHLDTILALLDRPLPREEVVARVGSTKVLDRLLRHGLVANDGQGLRAVASVYHQLRQEGMMSFLEHFVLPSLTAESSGDGFATLATRYLSLDLGTTKGLRAGRVQRLFDTLTEVSEHEESAPATRLTVMVIGTSRVIKEALDDEEQALRQTKEAALQRATTAEKELAVLSQYVFLAGRARYEAATTAVENFLHSLEAERASSFNEATYHLTVATHWRSATPMIRDEVRE
jgi:hypothetical protein